jgi:general secretion pathway protein M
VNPVLSPGLSRALAAAILVALLGLTFSWIGAPLWDSYAEARSTSERVGAALARAERPGPSVAALEAELARLKQGQGSTVGFLASPNESLAAAELQSRLRSTVDAVHGDLRSVQILPARDEGLFRRVSVRGQISATLPALQRVLYQLETATPLLFLDNVDIRARPVRPGRTSAEAPVLDVRFDLSAYMRRAS